MEGLNEGAWMHRKQKYEEKEKKKKKKQRNARSEKGNNMTSIDKQNKNAWRIQVHATNNIIERG